MWHLDNHTPYAAACSWIRDKDGAEVWIVAVKATYDIRPDGELQVAALQEPVNSGPVPYPGSTALRFETDLGPAKAATDVVHTGHAWSRNGEPVGEMLVGFRVGPVTRSARVFGDRDWEPHFLGDRPGTPTLFTKMPLGWDRAYGGGGADCQTGNPAGCGMHRDGRDRFPMPNIEHAKKRLTSPLSPTQAMGFGPVARQWPSRRQYGGTYDAHWQATRAPLLPSDIDSRHWQIAVPEQQVPGHLKGGEAVTLIGLTPPGFGVDGVLNCVLPTVTLGFRTHFTDGSIVKSRSLIHSVILDSDVPQVSVVHHMALPCHALVNRLDRTVVFEKTRPPDRSDRNKNSPVDWENLETA